MSATETKLATADAKVERAADKLQQAAERAAAQGGLRAKLAAKLAEDADFVRRLKPSLVVDKLNDRTSGKLAIWGGDAGDGGHFANLKITSKKP